MSLNLRIIMIVFALLLFSLILSLISKHRIPIRYSLFWMVSSLIILFVGIFPNLAGIFTSVVGFKTTSNFVIGIILTMLLAITLILTVIVSGQKRHIKLLIQEVSMLKREIEKDKKDGK